MVKSLPVNAGDAGSIPELGRSPGGGNGNPLQYPGLGNPMDEEPGRLQPMGSQRIRHILVTKQQQQLIALKTTMTKNNGDGS